MKLLKRYVLANLLIFLILKYFVVLLIFMLGIVKLDPKVKMYVFLGYAQGVKGFRLCCPNLKSPKFVVSWDVTFNEFVMLHSSIHVNEKGDQCIGDPMEMKNDTPD